MQPVSTDTEYVYLYDSIPSSREFPWHLETALTIGTEAQIMDDNGNPHYIRTPPVVSPQAKFICRTDKRQQARGDLTCGYWAIYNSIMTVLEGSDSFWNKLFEEGAETDDSMYQAGIYLRYLIDSLAQSLSTETNAQMGAGSKLKGGGEMHYNPPPKKDQERKEDCKETNKEAKSEQCKQGPTTPSRNERHEGNTNTAESLNSTTPGDDRTKTPLTKKRKTRYEIQKQQEKKGVWV